MWRRFEAEGTGWEVNATPASAAGAAGAIGANRAPEANGADQLEAGGIPGSADDERGRGPAATRGTDRAEEPGTRVTAGANPPDLADETDAGARAGAHGATGAEPELLEFRSADPNRPPRRLLVDAGRLARMDDEALRRALRQARPIGGDFYGRPGKRMGDTP